jgi:hypothetical protein
MATFTYYIASERGYDPSGKIVALLKENKYFPARDPERTRHFIELDHANHYIYTTQRKISKKHIKKLESLIGVSSVTDITDKL